MVANVAMMARPLWVLREMGASRSRLPSLRWKNMSKERSSINQFLTLGGRVQCNQCQAQSSRKKKQCRAPAVRGKRVCRTHGGLSTGPKTAEGRARCAQAKTIHGRETRALRAEHSKKMQEIRTLEELGFKYGFMKGSKIPGRKPKSRD